MRNFIFLRAARFGESQEALYEEYWRPFDELFWRKEISQGRLNRPRSDLFMQHFLASRQTTDIPIKHLFVEYKFWINRQHPFSTVRDELATLARQRDDFRRILEPQEQDILFPLVTFLDRFDIRTVYPLLLYLLDVGLPDDHWDAVSVTLESYLIRRAICGFTTKNYNRVFLNLTRSLQRDGVSPDNIRRRLSELSGDSVGWPADEVFGSAWHTGNVYQVLRQNPKIVHILRRLNDTYLNSKMERLRINSPLTVEHILPQSWLEHWPLPDGSKGLTWVELSDSQLDDPGAVATRRRNVALQTFGNLTILTQPLNSSVSNSAWTHKRALLKDSLLPMNQQLCAADSWDESSIEQRSEELFERAIKIWPGPQ